MKHSCNGMPFPQDLEETRNHHRHWCCHHIIISLLHSSFGTEALPRVVWRSNLCRSGVFSHLSYSQVWKPTCPEAGPGLGRLVGSGPALLDQRQNILWNVVVGQLSLPALCMVSSGAFWRIIKNPSTLSKMSHLNPFFMLLQAHPYLPGFILGLCLLRLLWCCNRGPRARPRHHVLAQRKMGLHWGALRFLPVCPQESRSQSHLSMQLRSFFRTHQIVTTAGLCPPGLSWWR